MPGWVVQGYAEYATRLPPECALLLKEIPALKRGKQADLRRIAEDEGARMLGAIPPQCTTVIALDERGRLLDTPALAEHLQGWMGQGGDVALLVGGPEGLAPQCRERASWQWSLSPLTLPHPLVRVVVAEQLYRAWAVLRQHPYHRA